MCIFPMYMCRNVGYPSVRKFVKDLFKFANFSYGFPVPLYFESGLMVFPTFDGLF